MDSLIGTTIGGFKLTEAIGSGTTGQIFAAADSAGGRAAIKILHPNLSLFTKVQAYWDELQKVGELSHPHITVASAADWSMSGRFYLALDYLEGLDLHRTLVDHGKLPPSQVLRFVGQICLALEAVHEMGLHHGAVKPHNIYLVPKGDDPTRLSTRLTDFASSQLLETSKAPEGTVGSAGVPNPTYLAPEQFSGEAAPAADIYALGVVLYEALSGRPPFVGSYEELAEQHANATPETPANAPEELAAVALKAMAKDPAERFADINAFREALEAWAAKGPAELKAPGLALFPKDDGDSGVGFSGETEDQTVRVSVEELEAVFEDEHQPSEVEMEDKQQEPAADKVQPKSEQSPEETLPQDDELAAIAEQASTALRKEQEAVRAAEPAAVQEVVKPEPVVEGYMDEDGDLVELPLERSVRAFVANISPTVPAPAAHSTSNGNGESLDAALDSFVQDAKAWSAALPPPTIDDHGLSELAKVPVVEPEPEPEPIKPEPVALPMVTHEPPPPQKSVLVPALIAAVLGGLAVFGGMKLFGSKPVDTPPAAATISVDAQAEPAPVAAGSEGTSPAAPVATSLSDAGGTAASGADTGATAAAPAEDAAPSAAATSGADAGVDAAPGVEPKPKLVAKARKKRARRKSRARRRARVRRKPRTARKPRKKPKKKAKPAGKKSDWVDPFAQ